MEYVILADSKIKALETKVNKLLSEGWKLQGGISAGYAVTKWGFAQAMTRKKKTT